MLSHRHDTITRCISATGRRNSSVGRALYFTTELHTASVRVRVQPGTKYLYGKKNVVWLSPSSRGGFTVISRECRDMSWLSPPQAALRILMLSNEGDAV